MLKNGARRRSILYSGLSISEWVSLCFLKTLWTSYLKNQWREFHPNLVTDVFAFVDVLIRFWDQKVKVIGGDDPKTLWTPYLTNQCREFHPILVTDVFGFIDVLISLWGQMSKSQQAMAIMYQMNTISLQIFGLILPKLGHICTRAWEILIRSKGQRSRSQQAEA